MAQVIELVGAPGVGKSTLARALVGRRLGRSGRRVLSATELLHRPARRLPAPLASFVPRPLDAVDRRRALEETATAWREFLQVCVEPWPTAASDDPVGRLYATSWLLTTLETTALARARSGRAGLVLLEEGLVQRALAVLGPEPDEERMQRFVGTVPCADLIVHLVAPHDQLVARVVQRAEDGRVIPRHSGLDLRELEASLLADAALLRAVVGGLERRGATVIEIASLDVDDAATALARALVDR